MKFFPRQRPCDSSVINPQDTLLIAAALMIEGYETDEFTALDHADFIVSPLEGQTKTLKRCVFMYRTARLIAQMHAADPEINN